MSRSAASLQQWLQLRQLLSARTPSTIIGPRARNLAISASTSAHTSHRATRSNDTAAGPARSFHTTRAQAAARPPRRAPGTIERERKAKWEQRSAQKVGDNGELFMRSSVRRRTKQSMGECLQLHEKIGGQIYDAAIAAGELQKEITFKTYNETGVKLIIAAFEQESCAAAVRAISIDVDAVFRIGHIVFSPLEEPYLLEWLLSSSAQAKARIPLVIAVNRSLERGSVLARTQWTAEIEKLANEEFPPAMLLHASILGRRGEYETAFKLFEKKILPRLSPTRQAPSMFNSMQLREMMDSPHRTYALLRASYDDAFNSPESRQKADEAIRVAAMEYNDPKALAEYASLMMSENNLDMYEECMCKAATAGFGNAAFYLGNFYYLTFLGKYPTRGERESGEEKPTSWIASFFNQSLPRKAYRELAVDWYDLALCQGNHSAAFMLALLQREAAQSAEEREDAGVIFQIAREEDHEDLKEHIEALEKNWFDPEYEPTLPKRFLAVR